MKHTAIAPSNIAFVKYWGKKNEELKLPENGSISMNLSNLLTTTTVEFDHTYKKDTVTVNGVLASNDRVIHHLDRIRKLADINTYAKVVTQNNFPSSTGLSSSASGFAALSLAGSRAAGLSLSEKELSILARQGSGSACRSIPDGFVEWIDGDTSDTSYAVSIFPETLWEIKDIVAIVSTEKKYIPTSVGMKSAKSSPLYAGRLERIPEKLARCKKIISEKNFSEFGKLIEEEALELDAIFMSSVPPLTYLLPETRMMIEQVKKWRAEGLEVYFTFNTGQNIHLIIESKNEKEILEKLKSVKYVKQVISNSPAKGAHLTDDHLF